MYSATGFVISHVLILQAVRKQWLSNEDTYIKHHRSLADYFQYHCDDVHVLAREAAYHINRSKDGKRLLDFIKRDERSRYIDRISISRYVKVSFVAWRRFKKNHLKRKVGVNFEISKRKDIFGNLYAE